MIGKTKTTYDAPYMYPPIGSLGWVGEMSGLLTPLHNKAYGTYGVSGLYFYPDDIEFTHTDYKPTGVHGVFQKGGLIVDCENLRTFNFSDGEGKAKQFADLASLVDSLEDPRVVLLKKRGWKLSYDGQFWDKAHNRIDLNDPSYWSHVTRCWTDAKLDTVEQLDTLIDFLETQ